MATTTQNILPSVLCTGPYGGLQGDEFVALDTETTGLWPFAIKDDGSTTGDPDGPDRLCSAAFLRYRRNLQNALEVWYLSGSLEIKVDPNRPISEMVTKVNGFGWNPYGITPGISNLSGSPAFSNVAHVIRDFLGDKILVAHNVVFDIAVLDAEFIRMGMPPLANKVVCTKKAFSDMLGLGRVNHYVPGTNLNRLCDVLGVDRSHRFGPDGVEMHGARIDAVMAASCFFGLCKHGWLRVEDPADLPHRSYLQCFDDGRNSDNMCVC